MHNNCNALDLAHVYGHSEVAEFLLSKGAKVNNCKKVSNILIILAMYLYSYKCVTICNEGHNYTCVHVTFQI